MSTITIHCDLPDRGARVNRHFGDTTTVCVPYYSNRTLQKFLDSIETASAENGGQSWGDDPVYIVDDLQLFCNVDNWDWNGAVMPPLNRYEEYRWSNIDDSKLKQLIKNVYVSQKDYESKQRRDVIKKSEFAELIEYVKKLSNPVIVTGDFNHRNLPWNKIGQSALISIKLWKTKMKRITKILQTHPITHF